MYLSIRNATVLFVLLSTLTALTACSHEDGPDDLAVAKMPIEEVQSANYLPLNPDNPGVPLHVQRYLVPGKFNVVEYYSPYDATCVELEPRLIQLAQARPDLAIRTININRPDVQGVDWQSPIAQEMSLQSLPFIQIFDAQQNLRAQSRPALSQIMQWVQELPNQDMSNQGMPNQGMPNQGMPVQTMPNQGMPNQAMPVQTIPNQGMPTRAMPVRTIPGQSMPSQVMPVQTIPNQSMPNQAMPVQTMPNQDTHSQSMPNLGMPNQ